MLIYVENERLRYPTIVPPQIQPVIEPNEWARISSYLSSISLEAHLYEEPALDRKVFQLNYELFEGRPVLSRYQNGILVNTEHLPSRTVTFIVSSTPIPAIPMVVAQHPVVDAEAVVVNT